MSRRFCACGALLGAVVVLSGAEGVFSADTVATEAPERGSSMAWLGTGQGYREYSWSTANCVFVLKTLVEPSQSHAHVYRVLSQTATGTLSLAELNETLARHDLGLTVSEPGRVLTEADELPMGVLMVRPGGRVPVFFVLCAVSPEGYWLVDTGSLAMVRIPEHAFYDAWDGVALAPKAVTE